MKVKGRVYRACVQRVLVYDSETRPVKVEDMQRLERTKRMMVGWMCGVCLKSRISSEELNARLGVEAISKIVRRGRLRWYGYLEQKGSDDWVSACRDYEVVGQMSRVRGRKTWVECVKHDLQSLGLRA